MAKAEASIIIDRPADVVWKFMTDLSNFPKWSPDVIEMRRTSSGPLGVGATLLARHPERTLTARVIEYDENRRFTMEMTSGPVKGSKMTYSLESEEGRTRLTQSFDFELGGLYRLAGPLISGRARKAGAAEAEANVDRVKRILES